MPNEGWLKMLARRRPIAQRVLAADIARILAVEQRRADALNIGQRVEFHSSHLHLHRHGLCRYECQTVTPLGLYVFRAEGWRHLVHIDSRTAYAGGWWQRGRIRRPQSGEWPWKTLTRCGGRAAGESTPLRWRVR